MYSKIRFGFMAALCIIFLCLASLISHAQLSKLDEWNGYKTFQFGIDKSQLNDFIKQEPQRGSYEVLKSKMDAFNYAFGDSVDQVYFKFNEANKLTGIEIYYHYHEANMDKDGTNRYLGKVAKGITDEFGKHTSTFGIFPNASMNWNAKNVGLEYIINKIAGHWVRSVRINKKS